jgi:hypothetical protein
MALAGTVGDVSGIGIGRGPATSGFCHCRCETAFSAALSSSATICSKLGELMFSSGARRIGLVTSTELLADSWLDVDIRDKQKPFRTLIACALCGAMTSNGGTGPAGG